MSSLLLWTCELSGEPLSAVPSEGRRGDSVVATPSGHVCWKSLLLTKLSENGGVDPFEAGDRPLTEDQLVTLNSNTKSGSKGVVTAPPAVGGMSSLLTAIHQEYDALVLELFDTRRALEEVRRELSHALYQNDAAVRVVARLAAERDSARQALQQWEQQQATNSTSTVAKSAAKAGPNAEDAAAAAEPAAKRQKLDDGKDDEADSPAAVELPLNNDIPASDLERMLKAWEVLHKNRKAQQKKAAASAPASLDELLAKYRAVADEKKQPKSWHKTTCKGISAMATHKSGTTGSSTLVLTAGRDKQLCLYDSERRQVVARVTHNKSNVNCLDFNDTLAVAGTTSGDVVVLRHNSSSGDGGGEFNDRSMSVLDTVQVSGGGGGTAVVVVHAQIHPDGTHIVSACENGRITILSTMEQQQQQQQQQRGEPAAVTAVAVFRPDSEAKYTCGSLHPDGLIYVAGSAFGEILVWDLKSKSLASTLKQQQQQQQQQQQKADALVDVTFSNNGYHIAAAYASGKVCVWDLRNQKVIATLNTKKNDNDNDNDNALASVERVAFDASGKYLAYGGGGGGIGVRITKVKEWGRTVSLAAPAAAVKGGEESNSSSITEICWVDSFIAAASNKQRDITFFAAAGGDGNDGDDEQQKQQKEKGEEEKQQEKK